MSFEDSFLNFCLNCDGTLDSDHEHGPYCSQSCRLADLEKSGSPIAATPPSWWAASSSSSTAPTTPLDHQPSTSLSSSSSLSRSVPSSASTAFHLPPAFDFGAYRRESLVPAQHCSQPTTTTSRMPERTWSISSHGSNAALTTTHHQPVISTEARRELRRYESLFESSRPRLTRTSWS